MPTPDEVFDANRHLIGSVPHVSNGFVCPYCLGPVTNFDQCFGCLQLFVLSSCPVRLHEMVVPASSVHEPGGWYTRLWNYKRMQPEYRSVLTVVLGYFYFHQHENIAALLGGPPTVVTIVPSKRAGVGFEDQALRRVVASVSHLSGVVSTLVYNPEFTISHNQYRPQAFDAGPTTVDGERVLLIEDTWISGATAVSAAAALCREGAQSVVILPIARKYDDTKDTSYLAKAGESYDPADWPR